MITSTTTHNTSIENICTKDKRKDNNFINNQIQKFPNDAFVVFTDGSCQNNPGPTSAGSLVFKDGMNNPEARIKIFDELSWREKTGHKLLPADRCKIDKFIYPLCPT